mgnify:CR=1 FL=1
MSPKNNNTRRAKTKSKTKETNKSDELLLRRVGLLIHKILYESKKPVEWLSFKSGVARSSIREIIAGRSNPRILTLHALAKSLGFDDVIEFLVKIKNKNGH